MSHLSQHGNFARQYQGGRLAKLWTQSQRQLGGGDKDLQVQFVEFLKQGDFEDNGLVWRVFNNRPYHDLVGYDTREIMKEWLEGCKYPSKSFLLENLDK